MDTQYASLLDLFNDHGIRDVRTSLLGHAQRVMCPQCHGGSDPKDRTLTVTIDPDGRGARWVCHRASCDHHGGRYLTGERYRSVPPRPSKPPTKPKPGRTAEGFLLPLVSPTQPDDFFGFWSARGIGQWSLDRLRVVCKERRRFAGGVYANAIVFDYCWKGNIHSRKFRGVADKSLIHQDVAEVPPIVFNADAIDRAADKDGELIWVEGEPDVVAMMECGLPNAVTLRDGAPKEATFKPDDRRFAALATHADQLERIKSFILAGDADGPGIALREELIRRLKPHKCRVVTWPEGCKDAGDVLRDHGPIAVQNAIKAAEPCPLEGIQRISAAFALSLDEEDPSTMTTGVDAVDDILKLPTEGRLIVVTGYANHGKSTWVQQVMLHTAAKYDRRWGIFCPEHNVKALTRDIIAKHFLKPFRKTTPIERAEAGAYFQGRVFPIVADIVRKTATVTVEWLMEKFEALILCHGITDALIDPWNEVEHAIKERQRETEYVGDQLKILRAFAAERRCNVWIVAHPVKPLPLPHRGNNNGEKPEHGAPHGYDISGSANWANKPDLGITVHQDKHGPGLHIWKSRELRWARRRTSQRMDFDHVTQTFRSPLVDPGDAPPPPEYTQ